MSESKERVNVAALANNVADHWKSFDVSEFNGNNVRFRVMEDIAAEWHAHEHSDELFLVLSGVVHIDTEQGSQTLHPNELWVVPAGMRHRARVVGRATLLVMDSFSK